MVNDNNAMHRQERTQFFRVMKDIPELGIRANMNIIANFDTPPVPEEYVLARFGDSWIMGECREVERRLQLAINGALFDLATADQVAAIEGHGWFRGEHF